MNEIAKAAFDNAGIIIGEIGENCEDLLTITLPKSRMTIGDTQTMEAAKSLLATDSPRFTFLSSPKATDEMVELIRRKSQNYDAIVAVGSGTLNDLCKMAAHRDGKPYGVVATAASMNGYVSANASITVKGIKSTLPATAPRCVLADITVIGQAPAELTQAGIGDTLCLSTVQADWLFSNLLTSSPYNPVYFEQMAQAEAQLCEAIKNDQPVTQPLLECLMLSGLAMRDFGTSAPASQGEHLIAHMMEMLTPDEPQPYHGAAIAVATLTMAQLQSDILHRSEPPQIRYRNDFTILPEALRIPAKVAYKNKFPSNEIVAELNKTLQKNWDFIRTRILVTFRKAEELELLLKLAGCPLSPSQIGWDEATYQSATKMAALSRDRLTFLDLI